MILMEPSNPVASPAGCDEALKTGSNGTSMKATSRIHNPPAADRAAFEADVVVSTIVKSFESWAHAFTRTRIPAGR